LLAIIYLSYVLSEIRCTSTSAVQTNIREEWPVTVSLIVLGAAFADTVTSIDATPLKSVVEKDGSSNDSEIAKVPSILRWNEEVISA
jgi:hypothetical protein